jgi:hypothetical protein
MLCSVSRAASGAVTEDFVVDNEKSVYSQLSAAAESRSIRADRPRSSDLLDACIALKAT